MQTRNTSPQHQVVQHLDIRFGDSLLKVAQELVGPEVDPEAVFQLVLQASLDWLNECPPQPGEEAIATMTLVLLDDDRLPVACVLDTTEMPGKVIFTTFENLTTHVERPGVHPSFRAEVLQILAEHYRREFPAIGKEIPQA